MSSLSLGVKARSDLGITRKLKDICQSLTLLVEQGKAVGFLANTENAQQINGLVEDIHEVLMSYQVCILDYPFSTMSDLYLRLHCNKISTRRVVNLLWVILSHLLSSLTNQ